MLCGLPLAVATKGPALESTPLVFVPQPSSRLNFSATLDAPAGKRGFLRTTPEGHFAWADGRRARFWGINVSSTRLDIPHEQIERVVRNFAHAGINLVRLEAIDNRNCLLGKVDAPTSLQFDPQYYDRIHYWMHCLRKNGIYYYLDLLDFRTFKEGDGVLNADKLDRAARPYALFDRYLIQLQKDYATRLLTTPNPYTGLRPVDDPALALVEICNEHGFFLYPEKLETLVEPYRRDLRERWNLWLRNKYATRERLAAAWGTINAFAALREDEDPAKSSVDLPALTLSSGTTDPNVADVRRAPRRLRDGVQFLSEVQRTYFREMRAHLRSIGLKIPVTAVVSSDIIPDLATVAETCDFLSENWYGENPREDPRTPGVRYYSDRNSLREDNRGGFAPFTSALRWNKKPVVIREWAVSWPNRWRASSVPEALAYAALQDFDVMLLFGYQTNRAPNGAEADALNDYAFQSDPTVWGLYALAGQAFLSGAIRPATHSLSLVYPPAQRFAWPNRLSELYRAAWSIKVESLTYTVPRGQPNVVPTGEDMADARRLAELLNQIRSRSPAVSGASLKSKVWRSDTGEITRISREGRLEIITPRLRILAGEFAPGKIYALGQGIRFTTATRTGAIMVYSLDGRPLASSRHLVCKMVSRGENSGQHLARAQSGAVAPYALLKPGKSPVLTYGKASATPVRLWMRTAQRAATQETELLSLALENGTWEMELREGRLTLDCDTPGIAGTALGRAFTTGQTVVVQAPTSENSPARATVAP
jgi:hypothetical protein